jgi:hypothetical protein
LVNSPFIGFGVTLENEEEFTHFYKHNQINYIYDAQEITEFNLNKYLYRLEKDEKYDYLAKEKEKRKKREKEEQDEEKKKQLENKQQINGDKSETDDQINKNQSQENIRERNVDTTIENLPDRDKNDVNVSVIDDCSDVLLGFEKLNVKIHFLSGNIDTIFKKKKYSNYFDFVFLGLPSRNILNNIVNIGKKNMKLLIELNTYMTTFNEKQKEEFKENLKKLTGDSNYILEDTTCKYVWKFIHKSKTQEVESNTFDSTAADISSLTIKNN